MIHTLPKAVHGDIR